MADDDVENGQARQDGIAVLAILTAVSKVRVAEDASGASELAVAHDALRDAVRTARYANTSWDVIAEALGVSRDKAYNQFRRRLDIESGQAEA